MGLALDEPGRDDQKMEAEGFLFVAAPDVGDLIRSHGGVSIDYLNGILRKGFQLALTGVQQC